MNNFDIKFQGKVSISVSKGLRNIRNITIRKKSIIFYRKDVILVYKSEEADFPLTDSKFVYMFLSYRHRPPQPIAIFYFVKRGMLFIPYNFDIDSKFTKAHFP